MTKHKAPTEVSIAPLFEKSGLERFFDRIKVPALGGMGIIVAWVLYSHLTERAERSTLSKSWGALIEQTSPDPFTNLPSAPPERLDALATELKDTQTGPWARLLEAQARLDAKDYAGVQKALATLQEEHPDHLLVQEKFDTGSASVSLAEYLDGVAREQQTWEEEHAQLFRNPDPPASAPRVTIRTSLGAIKVALLPEQSPSHVENFLKLCKDGFYLGTSFHRIDPGFMIQGGDPNSREEDVTLWGQGGPGFTLPTEPNDLAHFPGVLSAAKKPGELASSGSQFFITTASAHHLDGQHVVFGTVLEGMETVLAIAQGERAPGTPDRPANPVKIEATEVDE